MKKPIAPCKWCKNHKAGCHSGCEEYKKFEEEHKAFKQSVYDNLDEYDRYKTKFRRKQR